MVKEGHHSFEGNFQVSLLNLAMSHITATPCCVGNILLSMEHVIKHDLYAQTDRQPLALWDARSESVASRTD
jgi:hypothetical protein